ncbi:MAG: hypothetical protein Q4Q06_04970, partial [Bacteroidota bacterium]|nr:hypothetical protein [Bacteroidota bacterium]
ELLHMQNEKRMHKVCSGNIKLNINKNKNNKENTDYVSKKEECKNAVAVANGEKNIKMEEDVGKDEKAIENFEQESFKKPLAGEVERTVNDWLGDFEKRFRENLQEVCGSEQWRKFAMGKYACFSKVEKREIFEEFILRNAGERKYTGIYYDRDFQNEQRKHLINFLDKKKTIKKEEDGNKRNDTKAVGSKYETKFATDL